MLSHEAAARKRITELAAKAKTDGGNCKLCAKSIYVEEVNTYKCLLKNGKPVKKYNICEHYSKSKDKRKGL